MMYPAYFNVQPYLPAIIAYGYDDFGSQRVMPSPAGYAALSSRTASATPATPVTKPAEPTRQLMAAARLFYQMTVGQSGMDSDGVARLFRAVHQDNLKLPFAQAVRDVFREKGQTVKSPLDVVRQECDKGWTRGFFKRSQYKELEDFWLAGENTYRATAGEYRLFGMWRSVNNFVTAFKKHPLLSTSLMGAIVYIGHRFPVAGGLLGVTILAYTGLSAIKHELATRKHPRMNALKAEHYTKSGNYIAGFLVTLLGGDGIYKSLVHGKRVMSGTMSAVRHLDNSARLMLAAKNALQMKLGGHIMSPTQKARFVAGLVDEVFVPLNASTQSLDHPHRQTPRTRLLS